MGRFLVYACILVLAVFVLAVAFLLQASGKSSSGALPVSGHDLSGAPQAPAEERVAPTGVLRFLHEPDDHFIVTADGLGVIVRGYDEDALRALDGQTGTVTGRFGFDEERGTSI